MRLHNLRAKEYFHLLARTSNNNTRGKICTERSDIRQNVLNSQRLFLASIADMTLHKRRRRRSINDVVKVISVGDREIVTDKILVEAVSRDFVRIYVGEGTSFEWIPKHDLFLHVIIDSVHVSHISTYNSRNVRRHLGAHLSFSQMSLHRPLAIPTQYDLRIRTIACCLI